MPKKVRIAVMLVSSLGAGLVWTHVAIAEPAGSAAGSLTDSPYKNGPPPITGGYTDTSRGGTKTSGDPLAAPPSAPDKAAKSAQPQKAPDPQQQSKPQGEKAPSGG